MAQRTSAPAVTVLCMVVLTVVLSIASAVEARAPTCSRKPKTFVVYQQAVNGETTADNTRLITSSPVGELFVLAEPLTVAVNATSKRVGTTYGTISQLLGGAGSDTQFVVLDFHIDGDVVVNGYRKVHLKGTILAQGAIHLFDPNPSTMAVVGGTGDFLYGRGFLVGRPVAGSVGGALVTFAQKLTVWCDGPH